MAQTQAQVLALQKERYRKAIPIMYDREDALCGLIKARGNLEKAGPRSLRRAIQITPGGQYGTFNPDGGSLGRGSGGVYDVAVVTCLPARIAIEHTKAAEWNTADDDLAIDQAVKRDVANAMDEFKVMEDRNLHTDGTGVQATITVVADPVLTLAAPYRGRRLRIGHKFSIYDATRATKRGEITVASISNSAGTCTISGTMPAGTIATDVILPAGITGATPDWIHGILYQASDSASGTWDGIARTNEYTRASSVTATGDLSLQNLRLAKDKIKMQLGRDVYKTGRWLWYMNQAQRAMYVRLAQQAQIINKSLSKREGVEMMYNEDDVTIDGQEVFESITADNTRVDLLDVKNWGMAMTVKTGMYRIGDQEMFPLYDATDGGVAAAEIFYIFNVKQYFVDNPQRSVYIQSLNVPSGYN